MPGCVAAWCTNSSSKGFKMCNFPRNKERRDAWVKNMNRQNWSPTPHSALCEVHFASDMWEKIRIDGKKKLKANAVPTIFVTKCMYLVLTGTNESSVKKKNILDSVSILRRKSRCPTKKDNGLQKECDRQLHRNQVTNNEEANNNNESENAYGNNKEKLEKSECISQDSDIYLML
ncbi:THAP domain-containing protein 2-like [Harpegnathos saltator]|uniref:THAP domain-containing protein 2-like n=1 Tax=Harpegnathos saltator TaxID=610380 RepID=UPI00058FEB2B|nr:THAP domain-containing protein 2-like [Harpegnathos saltator]XP_011140190.1 THAP domain-containing protein 2-like [Harpegnathos saltator]XP_011140191.1 THAP domain-containing protein 2-like [Harpegnathos saltator]XP_011140192.1 THAP domain-containing protein 2-like [Harpegnathos saltator]